VAGHCLVRRFDLEVINSKKGIKRIQHLVDQGYMPEMGGFETDDIFEFINARDERLREQIDEILEF
jgi:hypothetical protein